MWPKQYPSKGDLHGAGSPHGLSEMLVEIIFGTVRSGAEDWKVVVGWSAAATLTEKNDEKKLQTAGRGKAWR